jgi:RNA polymerase sigma factor (sigma-70 family)
MKTEAMPDADTSDDARLVELGLSGDRHAFGRLVARYQSPVCALAYNACGDISQSQDLAQETFILAWRRLRDLKEPAKFKSWLYGIARNLNHSAFRRQIRNPLAAAEPLNENLAANAAVSNPAEQTISKEEEGILWRSLEQIPDAYREPLILFYREHQSIEQVADVMDLSEEAARQRLSRGRKLLQEQVLAFVEGALEKTNPGGNFTLGVVAALPLLATTAKSAAAGATAAKGGTALKMLFMTKTAQAIIVAAVTVAAVLTTQTVVRHYRASNSSDGSQGQVKLPPQEATEAAQAARDFLEANGKGDWDAVARFWPAGAPTGKRFEDIFTDKNKELVSGLQIVSLGQPYKQGPNSWVLVPYEVRFKSGGTQKNNLRIGKDVEGRWIWQGGF